MIKVSFKEGSVDGPIKKVQVFNDKVVTVTLNGHITMPSPVYDLIISPVWRWEENHPEIKWSGNQITVQGKAMCSSTDIFDAKLGEMIAESRAKIKLYKFLRKFTQMIYDEASKILTGYVQCPSELKDDSILGDNIKYNKLVNKERNHLHKLLKST